MIDEAQREREREIVYYKHGNRKTQTAYRRLRSSALTVDHMWRPKQYKSITSPLARFECIPKLSSLLVFLIALTCSSPSLRIRLRKFQYQGIETFCEPIFIHFSPSFRVATGHDESFHASRHSILSVIWSFDTLNELFGCLLVCGHFDIGWVLH